MTKAGGRMAAMVVTAVALAGCGGSALSDHDLRSDATARCQAANRRSERLRTPSSPATGAAFLGDGAAILAQELGSLRALKPPRDLAARYDAALNDFAGALAEVRAALGAISRGADPTASFRALELRLAPVLTREDASWLALQIPACVSR